MSTQAENQRDTTAAATMPWVDGIGFVLKMESLKKGEVINLLLENTSSGSKDDKSADSVVFGPYRPNGGAPWTSSVGPIAFQLWGSSTGDATLQDISVPIFQFDVKPRSIQIVLASNFSTSNTNAYFLTFYVWYKKLVTDLTMKRNGGKTNSSVLAWWVDANGDYNTTSTNFNEGVGTVEYPISS
ncbi:hypothetical protein [Trinickia acidisoli]|uniref:hypothetical protein n=1 Tax=Trinickia acidisoli TaxID=2767482 RepID=UPI001A8F8EA3|nr:hypothetical protein [Trinickia acidisoli]